MIFKLTEAPPEMARSSGDPKAFCYEFDVVYVCGHTEISRVWFPFGGVCKTSKQFETCALVGQMQCENNAKTLMCIKCHNDTIVGEINKYDDQ